MSMLILCSISMLVQIDAIWASKHSNSFPFLLLLSRNAQVTVTELSPAVVAPIDQILSSNTPLPVVIPPEHTHVVVIFTNQPPVNVNAAETAAAALRAQGVVIAVVYADNLQDPTYVNIASDLDRLFYETDFDIAPSNNFIIRSLCISKYVVFYCKLIIIFIFLFYCTVLSIVVSHFEWHTQMVHNLKTDTNVFSKIQGPDSKSSIANVYQQKSQESTLK